MVWKIFSEKVTQFEFEQMELQIGRSLDGIRNDVRKLQDHDSKRAGRLHDLESDFVGFRDDCVLDISKIRETIEHMGKVAVERTAQIQALSHEMARLATKGTPGEMSALQGRIEALEGRLAQMHGMLTEENPVTGKKKLSPLGKRVKAFYGK